MAQGINVTKASGYAVVMPVQSGTAVTKASGYAVVMPVQSGTAVTKASGYAVAVLNSGNLAVTSGTPPRGAVGVAYSHQLTASGGTGPYTWTAVSLPPGLSMIASGLISGTPTSAGPKWLIQVILSDSASNPAVPVIFQAPVDGDTAVNFPIT